MLRFFQRFWARDVRQVGPQLRSVSGFIKVCSYILYSLTGWLGVGLRTMAWDGTNGLKAVETLRQTARRSRLFLFSWFLLEPRHLSPPIGLSINHTGY